ncbi:MAG: VWA domain-containing protein [Acidobacteriota bacterium]
MRNVLVCSIPVLCLGIVASAGRAQEPLQEEAGVAIVEVPVFVTDASGEPVTNLKPEEFTAYEDGKKQELVFVQLMGAAPRPATAGAIHVESRRHFVLFFDLTFTDLGGLRRARDAALEFVEHQISPDDLVAVFSYSLNSGTQILMNFTSDRSQLVDAVSGIGLTRGHEFLADSAGLVAAPIAPEQAIAGEQVTGTTTNDQMQMAVEHQLVVESALKKQDTLAYRAFVRDYLKAVGDFARSLDVLTGRKYVIFFSSGFDARALGGQTLDEAAEDIERMIHGSFIGLDPSAREQEDTLINALYRATGNFASSDCRIYCVDPSGLAAAVDTAAASPGTQDRMAAFRRQTSLQMFASETGGKFFKNRNDLTDPLNTVVTETRQYYLLAYSAPPVKTEGGYHKIKVEVSRPDVNVSFRRGYFEGRPFQDYSRLDRDLQIAEVVNKDRMPEKVAMNVQSMAFPSGSTDPLWRDFARVMVQVAMPGRQFAATPKDLELDLYGFAMDKQGAIVDYFHGLFKMKKEELRERVIANGLNYTDLLLLATGDYRLKVVARNNKTGEIGVRNVQLSVPDFNTPELHLATPCFVAVKSDWMNVRGFDPSKPPKRLKGIPVDYPLTFQKKPCVASIYPNLGVEGDHVLLLKLYNLQLDANTRNPNASIALDIIDSDGKPQQPPVYKLQQRGAGGDGSLECLVKVEPPELPTGLYWVRLRAADRVAGKTVAENIPFFIE